MGDVPDRDSRPQPKHFEIPGQLVAFVVDGAQDVAVALYRIQGALKTGAIPVTRDLAAQNIQFS